MRTAEGVPVQSGGFAAITSFRSNQMERNHYSQFDINELILRDQLAIDRTLLANERTLLSYLRSGVALFLAGISIIHFSHQGWFTAFGFICIPCAIVTVLFGVGRFRKMDKVISVVRMELSNLSE
jgi:inner membrane protein YidH